MLNRADAVSLAARRLSARAGTWMRALGTATERVQGSVRAAVSRAARVRRLRIPERRTRSLVGDILLAQLLLATLVGALAIGGLWWVSKAVMEDNLRKWAVSWITELEDLGAPLYRMQADDNERFVRIEDYISNFPEITLVRYYSIDGAVLFSHHTGPMRDSGVAPPLSGAQLNRIRTAASPERAYWLDETYEERALFRASAAVWIERMDPAHLMNLNLESRHADDMQLAGFVELGLDFSRYQNRLVVSIATGSLVLALALIPLALLGRHVLKRALRPLSDLERPLARLAAGETEVEVATTGHKEILAIHSALGTTIRALNDRDKRLRRLADYDSLTGLLNRRSFTQQLEAEAIALQTGARAGSALYFVDLDQFKYVNDTLGHTAGDRVLVQAAATLHNGLRARDLAARFGGDEFVVLVRDVDPEESERIACQLVQVMRDTLFMEEDQALSIFCSVGFTLIGADNFTVDELLAQADMACREAKAKGRNRYHRYELSRKERRRIAADVGWSQRIKEALKDDRFVLHYQPIIQLEDGCAAIYEVLLRMRGERGRIIPPAAFMPAAHRFGLMVDLDHMVIEKAFQALAQYRGQGRDIRFTINLSGYAFEDAGLVERIEQNLVTHDIDPDWVIFEITEQVAVRQLGKARGLIERIMRLGCRFALDDFGAGFSSFNYLKHLPADFIKIDGGFIKNIANDPIDQAMVKSIIDIAAAVGKKTIAEYVQDAQTLEILRALGVDYAQGFCIGKPAADLCEPAYPLRIVKNRKRAR